MIVQVQYINQFALQTSFTIFFLPSFSDSYQQTTVRGSRRIRKAKTKKDYIKQEMEDMDEDDAEEYVEKHLMQGGYNILQLNL